MAPEEPKQPGKICEGHWKKSQHEKFMKALEKYGRDWVKVQKALKTRTLPQIRSHAQKTFLKMSNADVQALIAHSDKEQSRDEIIRIRKKSRKLQKEGSGDRTEIKIIEKGKQSNNKSDNKEQGGQDEKSQKGSQQNTDIGMIIPETIFNKQCKPLLEVSEQQSLFIGILRENIEYICRGGNLINLFYP